MLAKVNCLVFPCIPLVKDRFMTRQNRILCLALLCFALSGCADPAARAGKQDTGMSIKIISLKAAKGTPCVPRNNLAYTADSSAVLVCADNGGKGFVWKIAGVDAPPMERATLGTDCYQKGALALDEQGAVLFCEDDEAEGKTP